MKRKALLFLLMPVFGWSQNLVPNPSFEEYTKCPETMGLIGLCNHWVSFGNTGDYFNACSISGLSVPQSVQGFQLANEGVAYGGFFSSRTPTPNYREYLAVELIEPMEVGEAYYVSMWIAKSDGVGEGLSSNNQGIRFTSNSSYSEENPFPTDNFAHINNELVIEDTVNWYPVSGVFVSDSAYTHIVIGNFFEPTQTDTVQTYQYPINAYYFVDNVCVSKDSLECDMGTFASEIERIAIRIWPNPVGNILYVQSNKSLAFYIYDAYGQLVKSIDSNETILSAIDVSDLSAGTYVVKDEYGLIRPQTFIKIK